MTLFFLPQYLSLIKYGNIKTKEKNNRTIYREVYKMPMRKFISVLLMITIIFSLSIGIFAEEDINSEGSTVVDENNNNGNTAIDDGLTDENTTPDISTDEKADILNKLGIISGDGTGNYNLDDQLKRSESATFIVKVLGMGTYVNENKTSFKSTSFSDVKSGSWYMPYVSYCEKNNIIGGFSDGTYKPEQTVTEKAFISMLLKCLGYSSEEGDFTWTDIYSFAYDIGLVTDPEYENKTDDNINFTRGNVVDLIYKALSLRAKSDNIVMIQSLVNKGSLNRAAALLTGFFKDSVLTQINDIKAENSSRIVVTFNEEIGNLQNSDIKITQVDNKSDVLSAEIISQSFGTVTIKTSAQTEKADYAITISNVTDTEGNIATISGVFSGYKLEPIISDSFKISYVENVSESELNVYFTHPVNENSELASNYTIYENDKEFVAGNSTNMSVKVMGWNQNGVTITLKNTLFKADTEYRLKVSGNLVSAFGTNLWDGLGDEAFFIASSGTVSALEVKGITASSANTIKIDFNREINPVLAQQKYNFYVTDYNGDPIEIKKSIVMNGASEKGKSVSITVDYDFEKGKTYNLMINNINDITKQYKIEEKQYKFSGTYSTNTVEFKIVGVSVTDSGMITVNFNRALDPETAVQTTNYIILESGSSYRNLTPDNAYYSSDKPTQVRLYFKKENQLVKNINYTVTAYPGLKDYTGIDTGLAMQYSFYTPASLADVTPIISRAVIISKDTIKVEIFKKDISLDSPNSKAQNYSLEYMENGEIIKKIPIAVTYIGLNTIVLKFDNLDVTKTYTIKANQIRTYAGDLIESDDIKCIVSNVQ